MSTLVKLLLKLIYHNYPQIEEFVRHVPAHPYFGSETILKITWPQFLPNGVKKVIALDTDLLFNQNVHDLWSIFEEFDDHQMIGGAFELTDNLQRDMATPEYPILETGINSGVLLLHLERMRKFNWSTASVELTKEIISSKKGLRYSDQDVYNTFLHNNRHFFYELPCKWNVVINFAKLIRDCPLSWVISDAAKTNCMTKPVGTNLPGLLHICTGNKPEQQLNKTFKNPNPVKVVRIFSMQELHYTFFEVYFAFRNLSMQCFQ
ncbi:unnamed protein product [Calicophoron daubneyi]|uniref:UDP-D-xylose:beta-D-glucoside alpha-1,3-D-xylosyltransferase n=1 Tax=Calicophoron daubneyi TaxID=300641 RepID=A0AAV2TTE5_CALDB